MHKFFDELYAQEAYSSFPATRAPSFDCRNTCFSGNFNSFAHSTLTATCGGNSIIVMALNYDAVLQSVVGYFTSFFRGNGIYIRCFLVHLKQVCLMDY